MLADFQLLARMPRPPDVTIVAGPAAGAPYLAARWTPEALAELAAALGRGGAVLREIPDSALLDAWDATVEAFLDPGSPERKELAAPLAALCALSPAGLDASLAAVLGGVRRPHAAALFDRARRSTAAVASTTASSAAVSTAAASTATASAAPLVVVVLASNLPALAVQPLLPALALRRPVLLKSPSAEPLFAPAFLATLVRHEPRLASAVAAVTWPGGDAELEAPLLAAAGSVVAYGGSEALADLARRAPGKVVAYGPMTSVAAIDMAEGELAREGAGDGASLRSLAAGLARDVALFDQRGCLSIAAIYVGGGLDVVRRLAGHLQAALAELAERWPPGPAPAPALAAVQQARLEAEMRGLWPAGHTLADLASAALASTASAARPRGALPLAAGTVLVEPDPAFHPSPGLRTVRVHPLPELDRLPEILAPWRGRLQGAALAGPAAWRLAPRLAELGISRCAAPGELQSPDAAWHNGGIDPLEALAGVPLRGPVAPRGRYRISPRPGSSAGRTRH
jgi:Acyl-CoA reductase (LuxC)